MSKYDRNGVKHDGWADVGRANRGELNKDSDYLRRLQEVKERKRTPQSEPRSIWSSDDFEE